MPKYVIFSTSILSQQDNYLSQRIHLLKYIPQFPFYNKKKGKQKKYELCFKYLIIT